MNVIATNWAGRAVVIPTQLPDGWHRRNLSGTALFHSFVRYVGSVDELLVMGDDDGWRWHAPRGVQGGLIEPYATATEAMQAADRHWRGANR